MIPNKETRSKRIEQRRATIPSFLALLKKIKIRDVATYCCRRQRQGKGCCQWFVSSSSFPCSISPRSQANAFPDSQTAILSQTSDDAGHFSLIRAMHLADVITELNGACGVLSVFSSMKYAAEGSNGMIYTALGCIPLGFFFDALDGKVARSRKTSSAMGQELDSLADLVCHNPTPFGFLGHGWNRMLTYNRSHSASPQLPQPSPSASAHPSTMLFSSSSSSVVSPASHASTSPPTPFQRTLPERQNTSRACQSLQRWLWRP